MTVVEHSASHVVGSLLLLDEFAMPVHQEQISSEQARLSERIEEQIVDTLVPPTME